MMRVISYGVLLLVGLGGLEAHPQQIAGVTVSLSPSTGVNTWRNGQQVWAGKLSVVGDNDPAMSFDVDPMGAILSERVVGRTWSCSRSLGSASCVVGLNDEGDIYLDFAVKTKVPCRFLGFIIGGDADGQANAYLSEVCTAQSRAWFTGLPVPDRLKKFWPSGYSPFRCCAWSNATAGYCVSLAGSSLDKVFFCELPTGAMLVICEANISHNTEPFKFPLRLRLTQPTAGMATIVGRYAKDFRAAFGEQAYVSDPRPVVEWIRLAAHHGVKPTPDNPFGFKDWRPDTQPAAARAWADGVADDAKRNGFQGAIAWGFAYASPQDDYWGYPVDSRDLPTAAREMYEQAYAGAFGDKGLRWGCLQRAAVAQYRDAAGPVWMPVDGSPNSAKRLAARLTRAGLLHYVDTTPDIFGVENNGASVLETAAAFKEARKLCGPTPQWWMESCVDLCLPSAGIYQEFHTAHLTGAVQLARAVYPGCGVLAKDRSGRTPQDFRRWCDTHGLSALVEDWQVSSATPTPYPVP